MRAALMRVTLAATLCLAAGCSKDAPNPKPYTGPSKSTSASATGAPSLPASARGTSHESAESYVRYFIDVLNFSESHRTTAKLRSLYADSCAFCSGIADGLDSVRAKGGSFQSDGWIVRSTTIKSASPSSIQVLATVRVSPQQVVFKDGSPPKRFAGQVAGKRLFTLEPLGQTWTVANLTDVQ